jgi:hypothetical protein
VPRSAADPNNPPVTLEEQYEGASGTSDLGLPPGEGAGAQGILAAAAWNEVHMGTALMRLRTQWESGKPHKRQPRPVDVLRGAGLTREQARRVHNRERVVFGLAFYQAKKALRERIPEYEEVLHQLTVRAVFLGCEAPETMAAALLDRWLEDPDGEPAADQLRLWQYLRDCLNNAKRGVRGGMRGLTTHHPG